TARGSSCAPATDSFTTPDCGNAGQPSCGGTCKASNLYLDAEGACIPCGSYNTYACAGSTQCQPGLGLSPKQDIWDPKKTICVQSRVIGSGTLADEGTRGGTTLTLYSDGEWEYALGYNLTSALIEHWIAFFTNLNIVGRD